MAELSRRDFLIKGGAGAVAVGAFASLPSLARTVDSKESKDLDRTAHHVAATTPGPTTASESLVAYIPDPRSGEIHYMIGTREVVHKDSALVARMLRDAR
jgi:hypothetical protein